jgi:deoxyribodipyrimidine photo-lyase
MDTLFQQTLFKQKPIVLLLFRGQGDFRIQDNGVVRQAISDAQANDIGLVAIWRLAPHDFEPTPTRFDKNQVEWALPPPMGKHRFGFLQQNAASLAMQLSEYRIPLLVMKGSASDIVQQGLIAKLPIHGVYMSLGSAYNEVCEHTALQSLLLAKGIPLYSQRIHTLYDVCDYPVPVEKLPFQFSSFRRLIEKRNPPIQEPVPAPPPKPSPQQAELFDALKPEILCYQHVELNIGEWGKADSETMPRFDGSIEAGHNRINTYIFGEGYPVRSYKHTRNGLLGDDGASRFSPWLASGAISPRQIMFALHTHELQHGKNESTYWLYIELLWREYFQCLAEQQGKHLFTPAGVQQTSFQSWGLQNAKKTFDAWHLGKTGVPLCDAAMNELRSTGYTSNRARQNVASLLSKGLKLPWWWGAALFEHYLIDYDPTSNYANWQYVSGVGNDSRDRTFNLYKQSRDYDPTGQFIHHWLPELHSIPAPQCFHPEGLSEFERNLFGVEVKAITPLLPELVGSRSFYLG